MIARFSKLVSIMKREFLQVLPPTIFFFCAFNIVAFTTGLILEENQIQVPAHAVATVLALVVGKVVLVVGKMPLLKWFDEKPLLYPILFKTTVYTIFVTVVRLLEHWVPALIKTGVPGSATQFVIEHVIWRYFAVGEIWIFVCFLVYTTAAEVIYLFGFDGRQLMKVFFHEHPSRIIPK
jgi:hypothetical protein